MNFGLLGRPNVSENWQGALYDFARGVTPTASVGYNNIGSMTDGSDATAATATSSSFPQVVMLDLGRACTVKRAYIVWNNSDHRTLNGILQYSPDGVAWQDAYVLSGNGALSIDVKIGPITARFWRLYSTGPGGALSGIDIKTLALFSA